MGRKDVGTFIQDYGLTKNHLQIESFLLCYAHLFCIAIY